MGNDNHSCLAGWPHNNNKVPINQEYDNNNNWSNLPAVVLHDVFLRLSHKDRLNASSTCHNWRQALYHPSFWNVVHFRLDSSPKTQKSFYYISACSHLVRHATVSYVSLSSWCVYELMDLLHRFVNNYNIKTLLLQPSHCHLQEPDSESANFIEKSVLKPLLQICPKLEKLSLGCCEELCNNIHSVIEALAKNTRPENVHTLGLASVKDDPENYLLFDINPQLLGPFIGLNILSVDYDYASDNFLAGLRCAKSLTRLIIHVHGIYEGHPGTTESAWHIFKQQHMDCELRLTLIHAYEAVENLQELILHPTMPLSHLKVFFCEKMNTSILNLLSSWYMNSLRSIMWVDSRSVPLRWSLANLVQQNQPDPLVMAAWLCHKLEEVVLFGYKYFEEDLIAIARLRSVTLKRIEIADEDVIYSHEVYRALPSSKEELSQVLKHPWAPISEDQLHPVIKDPTAGDSDEFILPIVLADLQ